MTFEMCLNVGLYLYCFVAYQISPFTIHSTFLSVFDVILFSQLLLCPTHFFCGWNENITFNYVLQLPLFTYGFSVCCSFLWFCDVSIKLKLNFCIMAWNSIFVLLFHRYNQNIASWKTYWTYSSIIESLFEFLLKSFYDISFQTEIEYSMNEFHNIQIVESFSRFAIKLLGIK